MDFSALKRWMYLVVIMSVVLVGCWASVPTTEAEDGHGRDRHSVSPARDPGVRGGMPGGGDPIVGLTARQLEFFADAKTEFEAAEGVADGLGPRMNLDSCVGCHSQPATGGTSPFVNPQVAFASKDGGTDRVPFFLRLNGPVQQAHFKFKPDGSRDGGVKNTATITGRTGAGGCVLALPDFDAAAATNNLVFRLPANLFGAGLIEHIPDRAILANQAANSAIKKHHGIAGRANHSTDGTISRFGWKAQNKSLLLNAALAYATEMGISNEMFPTEREENPACQFATTPNDVTNTEATGTPAGLNAMEKFAFFMRFLAPPTPSLTTPGGAYSIGHGRDVFVKVGCALCHTLTLTTGNATVEALSNKPANLFSDLLVHKMGPGLADDIIQGQAQGDEFRTAPLWGLGQRIFVLHDGRTSDLLEAIQAHKSAGNSQFGPSEANAVIHNFDKLDERHKQDLLNFLRSL